MTRFITEKGQISQNRKEYLFSVPLVEEKKKETKKRNIKQRIHTYTEKI